MNNVHESISIKIANISFCCACLVALIHFPVVSRESVVMNFLWNVFPGAILRVAVPFFFAVSGFWVAGHFGEKGWWQKNVKKRVFTLLVPYFVLNGLWFAFLTLRGDTPINIFAAFGLVRGEYPALPHLWYILRLFVLVLISPVCWIVIKKGRLVSLSLILILLFCLAGRAYYVNAGDSGLCGMLSVFRYIIPPVGLAGFLAGAAFRIYGIPQVSSKCGVVMLVLGFALLLGGHTVNSLGLRVICFYLGLPIFLLGSWGIVPARKFPNWIVRNTFAIYVFHWIIFWVMKHIGDALGLSWIFGTVGGYFVSLSFCIVLSCLIGCTLQKSRILNQLILGGRSY